jgi:uncharacterized iron-regulated membrane protein
MTTTDTAPTTPSPGTSATLRPLLTRLHFYAGIFVGPFIVIAAVSGMLYAVSPQLEKVVHHDQLYTSSRGAALPLADQIKAARTVEPTKPLLAVRPAAELGQTTRVLFDGGNTEGSERQAVFVDPVTGDVKGALTAYGGSGSLPFRTWVDQLHRGLHLGDPGRIYSELAASWLWVTALAGLVLWWTGRYNGSRLRPARHESRRRRTLSWHGALGTWVVLGMLMLSATGLTWSQYAGENVTTLRDQLSWSTPAVVADLSAKQGSAGHHDPSTPSTPSSQDNPGVGYDGANQAAAGRGLSAPVEITGPGGEQDTYVVEELDVMWPTNADAASIDPGDGQVIDVVRFADYPFVAKLARWGIDLHMGLLFGVYNQVALVLLAGALIAMVFFGYRMWWLRRPTRGHRLRFGRPALRGTWRRAPGAALIGLGVIALGVGAFLPVLGVSLLGFLAIDAVVGLTGGRRDPSPDAERDDERAAERDELPVG